MLFGATAAAAIAASHAGWGIAFVCVAIYQGATGALGPRLLPREQYGQFCSANSMLWHFGLMAALPVAGGVLDALGNRFIFLWSNIDSPVHLTVHALYLLANLMLSVFLGRLSFGIYLWQQPLLNPWRDHWVCRFPVNLGCVLAAALLSYGLIEQPFLRLKDRFRR